MSENKEKTNKDAGKSAYRAQLLEERGKWLEFDFQVAKQLDQALLVLSAGSLSLSVTFIKVISPKLIGLPLIICSWVCFICTILLTLVSLFTFRFAVSKQIEIMEQTYMRPMATSSIPPQKPKPNPYNRWIQGVLIATCIFFTGGWILMVMFASKNLT